MTYSYLLLASVLLCLALSKAEIVKSQTVVFYNVENLFHPDKDSIHADDDFTPDGKYRWTKRRYYNKLHQIAKVITCIDNDYPMLVGLCEVENSRCLSDLCRQMPNAPYKFIHYESPDRRGIDVALLYDSVAFKPLIIKPLTVYLDSVTTTRDILYVKGCGYGIDTLNIFVCHLPSQLGGSKASQWKRTKAKHVLQLAIDSIFNERADSRIIVCGDMNSAPMNDLNGVSNLMVNSGLEGTHRYNGQWTLLDQFYVSGSVRIIDSLSVTIFSPDWLLEHDDKYLGYRPLRTFRGYKYNPSGFSDHLPILLKW